MYLISQEPYAVAEKHQPLRYEYFCGSLKYVFLIIHSFPDKWKEVEGALRRRLWTLKFSAPCDCEVDIDDAALKQAYNKFAADFNSNDPWMLPYSIKFLLNF